MRTRKPAHKRHGAIPVPTPRKEKGAIKKPHSLPFVYQVPQHEEYPHVIKFSGGRSSGMLLMELLRRGSLKPKRGDVVVFNNTSAEHPATYEFVRKCKKVCEKEYSIPFFWTEFQTYETASGGIYTRLPSYRLVNEHPRSPKNPNGYQYKGEVFEEMISWRGYLPNNFSGRICTSIMKLFVSKEFLRDWFALKEGIERLGHFGDESRVSPNDEYASHIRYGGSTPEHIFKEKKAFCWSRPLHRLAMKYADFSEAGVNPQNIDNPYLAGKQLGGKIRFSGDDSVDFCSFVGFRSDEPHRIARMKARLNSESVPDDPDSNDMESYVAAPEGEHVYAPLIDMGKTKKDVTNFWNNHSFDLALPSDANLSNCVYCFLKGGNALWQIAHRYDSINRRIPAGQRGQKGTPSDIQWWARIEEQYGRDLVAEGRKITSEKYADNGEKPIIGFFGVTQKQSYRHLHELSVRFKKDKLRGKKRNIMLSEYQNLPCDCTD